MALYRYHFRAGDRDGSLLFGELASLAYTLVLDWHEQRREPVRVTRDGAPLWGAAEIAKVYAACREDLEAAPGKVPRALARLRAREGGATG
jgi:hypothetical protein